MERGPLGGTHMLIETLARDLRLALRQLRGSPLFTATAVAARRGLADRKAGVIDFRMQP